MHAPSDPLPAPRSICPERPELWERYRRAPKGGNAEEDLIRQYLPLVKTVIGRLAMGLPSHILVEELYGAGMVGLLNAVRQFNPTLNPAFETYARVRIRGAVFDELRRMDWVPRSIHVKARQVEGVMRQLEQAKGEVPSDEEMAAGLSLTLAEYEALLEEIRPATFVSLDAVSAPERDSGLRQDETIADPREPDPGETASRRELIRLIAERLEKLPPKQRQVLALYYFEDLRLREIAEVFGVSESRICQIHTKAILAIRAALKRFDPCLA